MVAILWGAAPVISAALPAILIGLALLIILLASTYLLRKPLVFVLSRIPLIGGWVSSAVANGIDSLLSSVRSWVEWGVAPLIELVMAPVSALVGFASITVGAFEYIMDQLRMVTDAVAGKVGQLAYQVATTATQLVHLSAMAVAGAGTLVAHSAALKWLQYTFVPASLATLQTGLHTFTRTMVKTETDARAVEVAALRSQSVALAQAELAARARGDTELAAKLLAAQLALSATIAAVRAGSITYTDERTAVLKRELTQGQDITIPAALAAALAATAALALRVTRLQRDCIDPTCSVWGPQTGLLGQLMTGAELALVLSLVGSAVRDPEGSARVMAGAAGAMHGLGAGLMSPFIGRA